MKKNLYLIFCLFLFLVSCQEKPILILSTQHIYIPVEGISSSLTLTTNYPWSVSAPEWCSISPSFGHEGTTQVTISVGENTEYIERTGTVTFISEEINQSVDICQEAKSAILIEKQNIELSSESQEVSIEVSANVEYDVSINVDWIELVNTRSLASREYTFKIKKNETYDEREGNITFKEKDGSFTQTVTVFQAQKNAIILSKKEYDVDSGSNVLEIGLLSNVEVDVDIMGTAKNWISLIETKGLKDRILVFRIDANEEFGPRTGEIAVRIKDSVRVDTLKIIQGFNNKDIVNLSVNGTSNCYIVPLQGEYKFWANVIGNGDEGLISNSFHTNISKIEPDSIAVIWAEPNDVIEDAFIYEGYVYFKTNGIKGNAIVSAFNKSQEESKAVWSWHLWFTDIPEEINAFGHIFMDRNLGANSAAKDNTTAETGLYYQWGRKDPFPKEELLKDNNPKVDVIKYTIEHPNIFICSSQFADNNYNYKDNYNGISDNLLWGNPDSHLGSTGRKTIYDPCPVGYKVMPSKWIDDMQVHISDHRPYEIYENGILFFDEYSELWFPKGGFIYYNGEYNTEETYYITDYFKTFTQNNENNFSAVTYRIDYGPTGVLKNILEGHLVRCIKENDATTNPSVITEGVTDIMSNTASAQLKIVYNGNSSITSYGIKWGTSSNSLTNIVEINGFPDSNTCSVQISNLPTAALIYYQAFAKTRYGEGLGEVLNFNTKNSIEESVDNLTELYKKLYEWGTSTSSNYHHCFGVSSAILTSELMGEDMIMSSMGLGWFWNDCVYNVKRSFTSTASRSEDLWNTYYSWITLSNKIICDLEDIESNRKDYILGQAYGIRAYSYFMLSQWFARTYSGHQDDPCVPIFKTYEESLETNKPRAKVRDVYELVRSDINRACALLESSDKAGFNFTIHHNAMLNQYSIHGIRARICLVLEDWKGALESSKIAQRGTQIGVDNDVLTGMNNINYKNVIWGTTLDEYTQPNISFYGHLDHLYGGYASLAMKKINSELLNNLGKNDIRRKWWNNDLTNNKFRFPDLNNPYDYDYIWMRHEEMILIEAEAECRLGNDSKASSILETLIRTRDSEYSCGKTGTDIGELTSDRTGSLLEEIIIQRRIELWGEAGRIHDIRRLKQGFKRTIEQGWPENALLEDKNVSNPESYDWVLTIPQSAFDKNPSLDPHVDQNPY